MAIAGVPSMVNDFTGGSFMETHYHSQFDNDEFYDKQVYRLHHELFALLILALDETAVVPLQFSPVVQRIRKGLEPVSYTHLLFLAEASACSFRPVISSFPASSISIVCSMSFPIVSATSPTVFTFS